MTENLIRALEEEVGKCISCGFCESVCPTLPAAGYSLWKGARGRVITGGEVLKAVTSGQGPRLNVSDSFYSCLDCDACLYVCPASVNAGKVSHLSREIIAGGLLQENENPLARMIASVTMKYMNPLGVREECAEWSRGIQADGASGDLLYTGNMFQLMAYTGGMGNMRKRLGKTVSGLLAGIVARHPALIKLAPRRKDRDIADRMDRSLLNIAGLLRKAGINFNYLGAEEPYPGTFIYDLGYSKLFGEYAGMVAEILKSAGARRIITVDPHTYDLLKNVYPQYVEGFDLEVVHYLDLIEGLDYRTENESITFHEPCHFSLRDENYDAPLRILRKISEVQLPPRSGRRTKCCGGPDELLFPDIAEKVSMDRYGELNGMGTERIITACPICFANLNKGKNVIEIGDYISKAVKVPEQ